MKGGSSVESGPLNITPGRRCQLCHADLCDVTTSKISKGAPKIEHVDPLPDAAGTMAVTSTSNGYVGNVVESRVKRSAMLAGGVKLYTIHSEVCVRRSGSHRRT